tara:strand:+ start:1542 stop:2519 length:978 start_codon:yes stop_codon:yes gene_type:complete
MSLDYLISKIKKNNFLLIGRAGIDLYPDPPGTKTEDAEKFVCHLGGSSANMAVELTKLGGKCNLLTRVSDDALGRLVLKELKKYNISSNDIKFEKNESRISLALVESRVKNHQSIIYRHHAADLYLAEEDILDAKIKLYDCILITGTALADNPSRKALFLALEIAKKNEIPVIMDIDYRPYTWKSINEASKVYIKASKFCSGIIGNDEEFGILAESYDQGFSFAKSLSVTSDFIIYKKGDKGSETFTKDKHFKKGVYNVDPLKPTGAGDAFMGAFIGALLNNFDLESAVEVGSAAAAIVVTKVGCAPAMPNMSEINSFMKKNIIT